MALFRVPRAALAAGAAVLAVAGAVTVAGSPAGAAALPTYTSVACSPNSVQPTEISTCSVVVSAAVTPHGTVTFTDANGIFTRSPHSCSLVAGPHDSHCSVDVINKALSTNKARVDTVTASFPASGIFKASRGTTQISVAARAASQDDSTFTNCGYAETVIETNTVSCLLLVSPPGFLPIVDMTGTMTVTASNGTADPNPCTVVPFLGSGGWGCRVTYSPRGTVTSPRKDTLNVSYSGDSNFLPVKFTQSVSVIPRQTSDPVVTCEASQVTELNSILCTATVPTVDGFPTPTGQVTFTSNRPNASFSAATCTLVDGSCTVTYSPDGAGSASRKDNLTAAYGGDGQYKPATGKTTVAVVPRPAPDFTLDCGGTMVAGTTVTCYYEWNTTVIPWPTGTVTLTGSHGDGSTCTLQIVPGTVGCELTYTPSGAGGTGRKDTLTASYSGDQNFAPAKNTTTILVTKPVPGIALACGQPNAPTRCTVTLSEEGNFSFPLPTGTVTFSVAGGSARGTFSPASCRLVAVPDTNEAQCSVDYQTKGQGAFDQVTAKYPGNADFAPTSATVDVSAGG